MPEAATLCMQVLVPFLSGGPYRAAWRAGAVVYAAVCLRLVGSEAVALSRWAAEPDHRLSP